MSNSALSPRWMIQGLGLLRLYIGTELRLHIWDSELEYPNVSKAHTHSWDLVSTVVCGEIRNQRFIESDEGEPYWKRRLVCGVGCQFKEEATQVLLKALAPEVYGPGQQYAQKAREIHITSATPGTITLMHRQYDGPAGEADIFWPVGREWGTAEPRPATQEEVDQTIAKSVALITKARK